VGCSTETVPVRKRQPTGITGTCRQTDRGTADGRTGRQTDRWSAGRCTETVPKRQPTGFTGTNRQTHRLTVQNNGVSVIWIGSR